MLENKSSESQIQDNRESAQKSAAPAPTEHKQRCRLNAGRHDLTGTVYTMTEDDRIAWKKISVAFAEEFQPQTHFERQLIEGIAHDQWRMNRARAIEENALSFDIPDMEKHMRTGHPQIEAALSQCQTFFQRSEGFLRLTLYEQRVGRSFEKKLKLFREARAERQRTRAAEPPAKALSAGQSFPMMEDAMPPGHATSDASMSQTAPESMTSPENGFAVANSKNEPSHPEPAAQTSAPEAPETPKTAHATSTPPPAIAISTLKRTASPASHSSLPDVSLKIAV